MEDLIRINEKSGVTTFCNRIGYCSQCVELCILCLGGMYTWKWDILNPTNVA